jgi:hypothetical protein
MCGGDAVLHGVRGHAWKNFELVKRPSHQVDQNKLFSPAYDVVASLCGGVKMGSFWAATKIRSKSTST